MRLGTTLCSELSEEKRASVSNGAYDARPNHLRGQAMAIYRLIRQSVFEPEAIERMTSAYEHALKVLQLSYREDPLTELVARKIIEFAEVGETDPERLCARTLEALQLDNRNTA